MSRELLCNFKDFMKKWFYDQDTVTTELSKKADVNHTHANATPQWDGFLSREDKRKLNSIEDGANRLTSVDVVNYIETNGSMSLDDNGNLIIDIKVE